MPSLATLQARAFSILYPAMLLAVAFFYGTKKAIRIQVSRFKLGAFFSPRMWWRLILDNGYATVLAGGDRVWRKQRHELVSQARGLILELGAGTGLSLKYYKPEGVTRVIGFEPYEALHGRLREAIVKAKMQDKYEILSTRIEDMSALATKGIMPGTVDTVILLTVICSVEKPETTLQRVYELLKPGGQLLLLEHVRATDPTTQKIQTAWTRLCWHALTGCNFDRPTPAILKEAGEWSSVIIEELSNPEDIVWFIKGRLVKAG